MYKTRNSKEKDKSIEGECMNEFIIYNEWCVNHNRKANRAESLIIFMQSGGANAD